MIPTGRVSRGCRLSGRKLICRASHTARNLLHLPTNVGSPSRCYANSDGDHPCHGPLGVKCVVTSICGEFEYSTDEAKACFTSMGKTTASLKSTDFSCVVKYELHVSPDNMCVHNGKCALKEGVQLLVFVPGSGHSAMAGAELARMCVVAKVAILHVFSPGSSSHGAPLANVPNPLGVLDSTFIYGAIKHALGQGTVAPGSKVAFYGQGTGAMAAVQAAALLKDVGVTVTAVMACLDGVFDVTQYLFSILHEQLRTAGGMSGIAEYNLHSATYMEELTQQVSQLCGYDALGLGSVSGVEPTADGTCQYMFGYHSESTVFTTEASSYSAWLGNDSENFQMGSIAGAPPRLHLLVPELLENRAADSKGWRWATYLMFMTRLEGESAETLDKCKWAYKSSFDSPLFVEEPYIIRVNSPQQEAFVRELAAADSICGLQFIRTWEDPDYSVSGACDVLLAAASEPADLGRSMLDLLERLTIKPVSLAKSVRASISGKAPAATCMGMMIAEPQVKYG